MKKSIDVYSATGKHLANLNEPAWNAAGLAEGVYIIVAKMREGTVITQRLVVQH